MSRKPTGPVGPMDVMDAAGWVSAIKSVSSRDYANGAPAMEFDAWLGQAPEFDQIDEIVETDVVVCGCGTAGVAAVRAAAEEGARVVVFEKCSTPQARSGEFAAIGGRLFERWGIENSREMRDELVAVLMRDSDYRADQRIYKYWVENSGADLDWYMGCTDVYLKDSEFEPTPQGVRLWADYKPHAGIYGARGLENGEDIPLPPYDRHKELIPSFPLTIRMRPSHKPVMDANFKAAMDTGRVKAYFDTPAKKLVKDGSGRVTGVIAQNFDGRVIRANARKGVILSTGGYGNNLDMLYHFCPWTRRCGIVYTGKDKAGYYPNTGDGHKMGLWAGAAIDDCPHAPVIHTNGGVMHTTGFLELNIHGRRFMNEDLPSQLTCHQILAQPDGYAWQFFDSAWPEQIGNYNSYFGNTNFPQQVPDGAMERAIKNGTLFKADTLEELLEALDDMPVDAAMASIRRYNELAQAGYDADFGKRPDRMFPLVKGPFYASLTAAGEVLATMSGLISDDCARVYGKDSRAIPGLYVAGNVQGCRFSGSYPMTMPGISHSLALVYGRRAGFCAAREM